MNTIKPTYQLRSPHQSEWANVSELDYNQSGFEKRIVYMRADYMGMSHTKENGPALHRQYHAQFVSGATISRVLACIGKAALLKSTNPHLNDIPLHLWDRLTAGLPIAMSFKAAGDYATLAGLVCVANEAAHQWIESQAKAGE